MLNSPLSTRPVIEALEARIAPATFTVTTTADSGPGSLRQAILDANTLAGADSISFDIPGDQLQVIELTSPLPAITDKVTISGGQAPGSTEQIRLDGTNAGPDASGLRIMTDAANGTIIKSLQIANFSGSGVFVDGTSGVEIGYNQIFGNGLHGVHIKGGSGGKVYGNYLGALPNIQNSTGNRGDGLLIENSTSNLIGLPMFYAWLPQGNTVRANGLFGIEIRGGSDNTIAKNTVTENGSLAPEIDQGGGIAVIDSQSAHIGRAIPNTSTSSWDEMVLGNSISANRGNGVLIKGSGSVGTGIAGNEITGNLLGDGVKIDGAKNTQLSELESGTTSRGSSNEMKGNSISQNAGWGIAVVNGASNTVVRTNTLEGNGAGAILLDHTTNSTVGGLSAYYRATVTGNVLTSTDSNTIRFGTGVGVMVRNSFNTEITSNAFTGAGLPIDLDGDGPTANDPGDTDTGANHLQNYPTLIISSGQLTGALRTDAPNTNFRIQIYTFNTSTQEFTLFDSRELKTDANGAVTLAISSTSISPAQKFFATATNLSTGETSEFSPAATILSKISIAPASIAEGANSEVRNLSFTVTLDYPNTIPVKVGYRTTDGTAKAGEDYGAVEGVLVFEPGETTKIIAVSVFGDPFEEVSETFGVSLTTVENGQLAISGATGTIINDDGVPTLSIQDVITAEPTPNEFGPKYTEVKYTFTLSKASLDPVTVQLNAVGGTATSGSDYNPIDSTITFAPGTTSVTKSFYIQDDTTREETETILLQLSNPSGVTLEKATAVVSIVDNDTWLIQGENVQIVEGNEGQSLAVMKVRLVNSYGVTEHSHAISVNFSTTYNSDAIAGSDYVATEGTLTFQPGEFEKTITIPILGDTTAEQDEYFLVGFSNLFGATLQQALLPKVTILNDEPGSVSVSPTASITEGHSGQKMMVFYVSLWSPTTNPVVVSFETQEGTALAGVDFEAVAGQLTFVPGERFKTISLPIYGDRTLEQDETFTLKLTGASGATIATATATGTILNDDPVISIENLQIPEGQPATPGTRSVYLPVHLSQATDVPVTVDFATSNGTAEAPSDYIATSGTLTFAPGQTLKYIELQIMGDLTLEPDETFTVKLSNAQGAPLDTDTGVVTIKADEPFISAQNVTIIEGHSGTKSMLFTVSLSQAQSSAVTVNYAAADGTATAGSDYTAVSGILTFAPGETTKTVSVPIRGDTLQEADETLHLLLSNVSGASLATAEAQGVISDDDAPVPVPPVLSVADMSIAEGDSGSKSLVFTFNLSKASTSAVSVKYTTAALTATAGSDYTSAAGILTFAPGEITKAVSVSVLGDTLYEADEIFRLLLSNPSGVSLEKVEVRGTITNDDSLEPLPVLSVANASTAEGNAGIGTLNFTFSLSKASTSPVSVQYVTADGTAHAGSDYVTISGTLTFAPGETTKTVPVTIFGDQQIGSNETLRLLLSGVSGATLGTAEATGIIIDDDTPPPSTPSTLSVHGSSVFEGYSGTKSLVFTVTLSEANATTVAVWYSTQGGSADYSTSDKDYLAVSGSLIFAPGETSKTVEVPVFGDGRQEENETVFFEISNPKGATITNGRAVATGTILNDDLGSDHAVLVNAGKGKFKALWTENDGDLVTLITNNSQFQLSFGYDADGHTILQSLHASGKPSSVKFIVQPGPTGDGKVNVGEIVTSTDLTEVSIPGRLGRISAGDANLKTPAIGKLTVDSFGLDSATAQAGDAPLLSEIKGSIGSFVVKHDFSGANLTVSGGSVGSLVIGGSLEGTSAAAPTGISIEKNLGTLRVGGDVNHANVIAGSGSQAGAHVEQVLVGGDWIASNLVVGAGAGPDGLYGTGDDEALQDSASRIARITIHGAVVGTAEAENGSDHFGFVAGRIAAFQVGVQKLALTSKWRDSVELGSTSDVMLLELSGRSRS